MKNGLTPLGLLAVALIACGGGPTKPEDRPLVVGRYGYTFRFGLEVYDGHLVLTSVTESAIDGRWEVDGFQPKIGIGSWNVDAYLAWAVPLNGGNISQRIWSQASFPSFGCSAKRIRPDGFGGVTIGDATCTLVWEPM